MDNATKWLMHLEKIGRVYQFADIGQVIIKRNVLGQIHSMTEPSYVTNTMVTWYQDGKRHGVHVDKFGSLMYYYKGISVPNHWIENPERLTCDEIVSHKNTEVRRVGVEIYGFDRMIREGYFKLVHSQKNPDRWLYELEVKAKEKSTTKETMKIIKVLDGTLHNGKRKEYFLQVPPRMKNCQEAVAWTFRKTPEEYSPSVET